MTEEPKKNSPLKLKDLIKKFKDQTNAELLVTLVRSDGRGSTTFAASSAEAVTLMNTDEPVIELVFTEYIPLPDPPARRRPDLY